MVLDELLSSNTPAVRPPIIGADERKRLLVDFNRTSAAVPQDATLASLCARQAEQTPDATAAICGSESISYAALHAQAAALASRLAAMGVGPEIVVGIALSRSIDLLVAVLAIHKAGGAYLPLDPDYPPERIAYIIADARAPVIVTTSALAAKLPQTHARLLLLDAPAPALPAQIATGQQQIVAARPDNLAYVIYTSGSTGQPKGVAVEHRSVVNLVLWGASLLEPDDLTGVLFSTSLNFDVSVYELFVPLICGGRIILVENLLAVPTAPARDEIRVVNAVPSIMAALLKIDGYPRSTRAVHLAGERFPRPLADQLFALNPKLRLFNYYGPTEAAVYAAWSRVHIGDSRDPAIGSGVWNTQLYVLDRNLELVPEGAKGELYIGGIGVARGYLNKPDLTAERFLKNQFGEGRLYHTGDLVRWRSDGELEYLGRADTQVKINGLRVELGEIEKQLEALPWVDTAAAIVCPDASGVDRICAYATACDANKRPEFDEIVSHLKRTLPHHMVPSAVVWMESFPLNPNGKLDRSALPRTVGPEKVPHARLRLPQDDTERALAQIWQDILNVQTFGIDDNFYDLGGTSLQAFMIFARIAITLGYDLPPTTMMRAPTIARQAHALRAFVSSAGRSSTLVTFRERGQGSPLFVVHGGGGDIMYAKEIARDLASDRPVYGLQPPPLDGKHHIPRTVKAIAAGYLAEVLKMQPEGPYYLAGYSFGGWVALEMAQQLARTGEDVAFLGIIDTLGDMAAETSSSRIRRHVHEFKRKAIVPYLSNRVKKTLLRRLELAKEAARHLPNDVRTWLGRSVPYPERTGYYLHTYMPAASRYDVQPYPGQIVVFCSAGRVEEQQARWSTIARGGLTVHENPGDHWNLVWPPHSTKLAEAIDQYLGATPSRPNAGHKSISRPVAS